MLRKVKFSRFIPLERDKEGKKIEGTGRYENDYLHDGRFHEWGYDSVWNEEGTEIWTIGLIELNDGTIEKVIPDQMKFVNE